jgi:hypothetical protein
MSDPHQKSTSRDYTTTVAFLAIGFIFSPAMFVALGVGYLSLSLAIALTLLCVTLAWVSWKRSTQLSVPSIATQRTEAK